MSDPWLSVIVPTYNGAAYLSQALDSIAGQHDDHIEIIAIDDGSTDTTPAILRAYSKRLPLSIYHRRVGNWVANTNYGMAQARARHVSFLHQDDLWLPGRLAALRQLVQRHPEAELILAPSRYINARGRDLGLWSCPLPAGRQKGDAVLEAFFVQNFVSVPAPLFTREAARRVGGLDDSLWYTADWEFWIKLASTGSVVYHPEPLAAFRLHAESQTARGRAEEMRRQIKLVLSRHLEPWHASNPDKWQVAAAALLSLEVNHNLAACAHGCGLNWSLLARHFLALGPGGWYRFFRDSRIVERVTARLRARNVAMSAAG